jgi:asparagine synthase (glutamine-hydrolysing)
MCGIAGVLTFDHAGETDASAAVARMVRALGHRGPDGQGTWTTQTPVGQLALGHTRLAIIDLSEGGAQPMARRHLAVTYNGELYNYRAIAASLSGDAFESASDTEVLLAAWLRWGSDALDRLDGMFAFALWDSRRDTLVLARDRFGIKPLYFHANASRIVFASEVRALLASGLVERRLDPHALWHYLGYQTAPTPRTLVDGVEMLDPGGWLEIDSRGQSHRRRYWHLLDAAARESVPESRAAAAREVQARLTDAVTSHMVSDVPVGVFLSGGVDSGALISTLRTAGLTPHTFTVALGEHGYDESIEAAAVARAFGTTHQNVSLREDDLLAMLPDVLAATDHPSGDGVNTYVVSRAVREQGVKVALSGLGGDELFGGYDSFRRLDRLAGAARQVGRSPAPLRRAAASVIRQVGGGGVAAEKAAAVLDTAGTLAELWPVTRQLYSVRARRGLLPAAMIPDDPRSYEGVLADAYANAPQAPAWACMTYAETRAYMHDVLLRDTDQMSMAHALEVRVPFLDHRLAAFVTALPDAWKREGGRPKALLLDALEAPLPAGITGRPKRGFTLPFDLWMRGALRPFCEAQLGAQGLDGRGLLQPGQAAHLWQRFLDRAPGVTWGRIWPLVALNAWLTRQSL